MRDADVRSVRGSRREHDTCNAVGVRADVQSRPQHVVAERRDRPPHRHVHREVEARVPRSLAQDVDGDVTQHATNLTHAQSRTLSSHTA
jgi:hypothetical protein